MAALTVDEGSSQEQLWITGGDDWDYGYSQSGIDIYDGNSFTASSIELPGTFYNHHMAQVIVFDQEGFIFYLPIQISVHENMPIYTDNP